MVGLLFKQRSGRARFQWTAGIGAKKVNLLPEELANWRRHCYPAPLGWQFGIDVEIPP